MHLHPQIQIPNAFPDCPNIYCDPRMWTVNAVTIFKSTIWLVETLEFLHSVVTTPENTVRQSKNSKTYMNEIEVLKSTLLYGPSFSVISFFLIFLLKFLIIIILSGNEIGKLLKTSMCANLGIKQILRIWYFFGEQTLS